MICDSCGRDGFPHLRSLTGHRNWCRKRKDPTYNTRRLIALRSDVVRVARDCGVPEGYGPPMLAYKRNGRFSDKAVMGWLGGYRPDGNARITWRAALAKFHLKMWGDLYHADPARIAEDVRRVARLLGRPHHIPPRKKYNRLGDWDHTSVYLHLGVTTWEGAAERLDLRPNRAFPTKANPPTKRSRAA